MKFAFQTNSYMRKLTMVWDAFAPQDSQMRRLDPRFFGEPFHTASKVYTACTNLCWNPRTSNGFWTHFLDSSISKTIEEKRYASLVQLLDSLELPMARADSEFYLDATKQFVGEWKKHENRAGQWMQKIFGFGLPAAIDVVFNPHEGVMCSGSSLNSNPTIIALQPNLKDKTYVSVLIHEILHAQIRRNKQTIGALPKRPFEEALLDYFAPRGIFDEMVGLSKHVDLERHHERNSMGRPSAAQESRKLLPVITEYAAICGEKTIWQFLKEKKII